MTSTPKCPEQILRDLLLAQQKAETVSAAAHLIAKSIVELQVWDKFKAEQTKKNPDKFDFETILNDLFDDIVKSQEAHYSVGSIKVVYNINEATLLARTKTRLLKLPLPAHYEIVDWQHSHSLSAEHQKPVKIRTSAEDTGFYADVTCPNGHKASLKIEVQSGSVRVYIWPADDDGEIRDEPLIKFANGYNEFDGVAILAEF